MPSISSAQQSIMGQAWAVRTGEMKLSEVAPKYRKEISAIAKGEMTDKELKKFASTKSKNLPHYVHNGKPSNKPVKESEDFEEDLDEKGIPMAGATSPIIASKGMPTFTPGLNPGGGIKPITPFLDPDVRKPAGKKKMKHMADYRDYILKEDKAQDKLDDLSNAFQNSSVEDYVSLLKKYQTDPKVNAALKSGITDGRPDDEKFDVQDASYAAKDLKPTQHELGSEESLKNILTDQYGSLEGFIKGDAKFPDPIITYNGEFVIDGHHRWSQAYAANPEAKIQSINIVGKIDPKDILKAVHTAIATDSGETKTISANLKAGNLLDFDSDKVKKYVDENLTDKARKVWNENGVDSDKEIANKIAQNVDTMISNSKPENWAPSRDSMPQPGVSGSDNWETGMTKGQVNLISPKTSDVQESDKREKMKHMSNYRDFIKGKK